ncbi:MAG: hypothetical protein E7632_04535 [Ruminococcaceae bacterium]|nr:hypothetical protein [Oscillospiraceae bacterium]
MGDKPNHLNDIDNFWDLNSLLPKKRPVSPTHRAVNTETVELELGDGGTPSDSGASIPPRPADYAPPEPASPRNEARRLNEIPMRRRAEANRARPMEPYLTYEPDSRLLRRVAVSKWHTHYNFYEKFRDDARRYWDRAPAECEPVSFFSYIPQYNQLKYAQLRWYIKWRDNVRRGIYLRTDFSYILLYIFEIINCPDLIEPSRGLELLCDIWLNYRTEHRRIDSYLCDWVCDFCLINQLPCPTEKLEPILGDIVAAAEFKEFYMDAGTNISSASSILTYCSTYDWRSSRYVTKENVKLFAAHIRAAFDKAYSEVLAEKFDEIEAKEAHMERDAYNGALCVWDMKRSLSIDYISYARSPKFRFVVTDIIKYSENRIRMALGIKARLKVEELSDTLKACIDEYFDANLPAPEKHRTKPKEEYRDPEYDKLYEPATREFSMDNALAIEKNSWSTTEILTSALTDEPEPSPEPPKPSPIPAHPPIPTAPIPMADDEDEFAALLTLLDDAAREALRMLADGDSSGVAKAAASSGMLADALADKINETAFDLIGDSVIEPDGTGYTIITEYKGELEKWLK